MRKDGEFLDKDVRPLWKRSTIKELKSLDTGERVCIECLISSIDIGIKKDSSEFIQMTICDKTDTLKFPVWDDIDYRKSAFSRGDVIELSGIVSDYEGVKQIRKPTFCKMVGKNIIDYVPSYSKEEISESWEFIEKQVSLLSTPYQKLFRECFDEEKKKQFLEAPAAVKHHHNKIGGLVVHTKEVLDFLVTLLDKKNISDRDEIVMKVCLHDIGKTKEYLYPIISYNQDSISHLYSGAMYVYHCWARSKEKGEEDILSEQEVNSICMSIMNHHGEYGDIPIKTKEDEFVHMADNFSAKLSSED